MKRRGSGPTALATFTRVGMTRGTRVGRMGRCGAYVDENSSRPHLHGVALHKRKNARSERNLTRSGLLSKAADRGAFARGGPFDRLTGFADDPQGLQPRWPLTTRTVVCWWPSRVAVCASRRSVCSNTCHSARSSEERASQFGERQFSVKPYGWPGSRSLDHRERPIQGRFDDSN
jgi:hypothetical protein